MQPNTTSPGRATVDSIVAAAAALAADAAASASAFANIRMDVHRRTG